VVARDGEHVVERAEERGWHSPTGTAWRKAFFEGDATARVGQCPRRLAVEVQKVEDHQGRGELGSEAGGGVGVGCGEPAAQPVEVRAPGRVEADELAIEQDIPAGEIADEILELWELLGAVASWP
jgi:hypothetical protein